MVAVNASSQFPYTGSTVAESDWDKWGRLFMVDGIVLSTVYGLNNLAISQHAGTPNLSVDVATGRALVQGHFGEWGTVSNLTIAPNAGASRIDLVVARWTYASGGTPGFMALDIVQGSPGGSAPAVTQSTVKWEISLAQVTVGTGVSQILNANILGTAPVADVPNNAAIGCSVTHGSNQAIANTYTFTTLSFGSEEFKSHAGFHSNSSSNSRITIPQGLAGTYVFQATAQWTADANGIRGLRILKNGATVLAYQSQGFGGSADGTMQAWSSRPLKLIVGDYVELQAAQNSTTGNLNVLGGLSYAPMFSCLRVGS